MRIQPGMHGEWRDIPSAPGYQASESGHVRNARSGRVLTGTPTIWGHLVLGLQIDGRSQQCRAHQLVLEAFVGPRPEGMVACHGDGNPANNVPSNLRWDTPRSNALDSIRHGTHNFATLRPDQLDEIRSEYATGAYYQKDLAKRYGVSQSAISRVVTGRTFAW